MPYVSCNPALNHRVAHGSNLATVDLHTAATGEVQTVGEEEGYGGGGGGSLAH